MLPTPHIPQIEKNIWSINNRRPYSESRNPNLGVCYGCIFFLFLFLFIVNGIPSKTPQFERIKATRTLAQQRLLCFEIRFSYLHPWYNSLNETFEFSFYNDNTCNFQIFMNNKTKIFGYGHIDHENLYHIRLTENILHPHQILHGFFAPDYQAQVWSINFPDIKLKWIRKD
jgi:hypothetical protein